VTRTSSVGLHRPNADGDVFLATSDGAGGAHCGEVLIKGEHGRVREQNTIGRPDPRVEGLVGARSHALLPRAHAERIVKTAEHTAGTSHVYRGRSRGRSPKRPDSGLSLLQGLTPISFGRPHLGRRSCGT
jgi:hypothetical protein